MKLFYLFAMLVTSQVFADVTGTYGLHLFFNEKEFVDVLTLTKDQRNRIQGEMVVPNDFTGAISNAVVTPTGLRFDLFVPKNSSRPQDLIFQYDLKFFDDSHQEFTGFVTIKGSRDFVASFVGFKRLP